MSYATVSGEVAIRNHGTSVVPYVDALIAALDKYYTECDLYEILLYVQRLIENQKIPIGSNGQFMKGKFQQNISGSKTGSDTGIDTGCTNRSINERLKSFDL